MAKSGGSHPFRRDRWQLILSAVFRAHPLGACRSGLDRGSDGAGRRTVAMASWSCCSPCRSE